LFLIIISPDNRFIDGNVKNRLFFKPSKNLLRVLPRNNAGDIVVAATDDKEMM